MYINMALSRFRAVKIETVESESRWISFAQRSPEPPEPPEPNRHESLNAANRIAANLANSTNWVEHIRADEQVHRLLVGRNHPNRANRIVVASPILLRLSSPLRGSLYFHQPRISWRYGIWICGWMYVDVRIMCARMYVRIMNVQLHGCMQCGCMDYGCIDGCMHGLCMCGLWMYGTRICEWMYGGMDAWIWYDLDVWIMDVWIHGLWMYGIRICGDVAYIYNINPP